MLKKYKNAPINETLKYYSIKCLDNMKKGMTLTISIRDNNTIDIIYYKN